METEFNWYTELDNAIKAEPTDDKFYDLENRANSWVNGPCGQLCKKLPLSKVAPEESYFYANGAEFRYAVQNKDWFYAKIVLERIEKRTIELLKELKL